MRMSNSAEPSATAFVRTQPTITACRPIDFRAGADHIQGRRGVDYAIGDTLITLKASYRIGVQRAVAR